MNLRGGKRTKKKRSKSKKKAGYRKTKTRTFNRSMRRKLSLARLTSIDRFMKNYSQHK
tara:strand:+ start:818 stop:991 length:174 start_codon:yes stop_codon:yes gene_type:complete